MPIPGKRTKDGLAADLDHHASLVWPGLEEVTIRWRGGYGYVTAWTSEDDGVPVCRLEYLGFEDVWGFALHDPRRARQRQREFYGDLLSPKPGEPYLSTLRRTWQAMTGLEGRPYLSMFGKLRQDAEQQLWPNFRREATTDWLQPLEDGMRTVGRPELATLVLAAIRGLIMDVEATGDTPRADRAFDDFLDALVLMTTAGKVGTGGSSRS